MGANVQSSENSTSLHDDARPPRRPWLAFALSLLAPGLGHLYSGFVAQALLVVAAWGVLGTIVVWLYITPFDSFFPVALATAMLAGAYVGVPAHAATVSRSGAPLPFRRAFRIGVYIGWLIVFSGLADRSSAWVRAHLSEPFRVPSSSMYPTLQIGDRFFADKHPYSNRNPQRGDVIVFEVAKDGERIFPADERPDLPRKQFVQRIVGVPGDRVGFSSGALHLNGQPVPTTSIAIARDHGRRMQLYSETLSERSHKISRDAEFTRTDPSAVVVPPRRYFTIGDNRDHSNDSRNWGTVSRNDIIARVSHLYFARDSESGSIAWKRIGSRID